MNKTPKNIMHNPKIAIVAWNKEWEKNCTGYEFIGTAQYLTEGKWQKYIKNLDENKNMPTKGAILVTISAVKRLA
jgi:hypothetical protein